MSESKPPVRLAADIGGTFTDIVLEVGEHQFAAKILTTPDAPELAVVNGAQIVLREAGLSFGDVSVMLHGTTLATNAIIERKGARTALIATEGFRDVIEIADESRYDQYDVFIEKPSPLVKRAYRFTVPERLDVEGHVHLPLDENAVRVVAQKLRYLRVEAVAIAFLHSYVDDSHEQRAGEIVHDVNPDISITLSSGVCPEAREYERTSTAIANAYVQPLIAGYLQRLAEAFRSKGYRNDIHLITSAGSLASLETARQNPVRLVESGPAGGAILAAGIAEARGAERILSFDMGGTTAKICLIEEFEPLKARIFEVDRASRFMKGSGLPVRIPVIEMVEIGAGGGSIAKIDALRRIQVGPESAGSQPGPASYGLGGTEPTVTDADLALGKIDPSRFAGGKIAIHPALASGAIERHVGETLGSDVEMAAYGISEIVDENMANAARVHAVERGVSISDRTLIAFGGAAPLHAARLAEKLDIARIIIPKGAGVGSAIGFLRAPAAYEIVRSRYVRLDDFDVDGVNDLLSELTIEATTQVKSAAGARPLVESRGAYMRYAGQGHEIYVQLPERALACEDVSEIRSRFEIEYKRLFARYIPNAAIEIMSWVVAVATPRSEQEAIDEIVADRPATSVGHRSVFDAGLGRRVEADIFERDQLARGERIFGPAIVVEEGTSTLVTSRFDAHVDGGGALVLTLKEVFP
ncbi:MAG: hydantoinase/oxoprolinase family protein [Hyphomicrobiaceae bacterium]